jgi:hypothetical protein
VERRLLDHGLQEFNHNIQQLSGNPQTCPAEPAALGNCGLTLLWREDSTLSTLAEPSAGTIARETTAITKTAGRKLPTFAGSLHGSLHLGAEVSESPSTESEFHT